MGCVNLLEVIRKYELVDARRLARELNISPYEAGILLSVLTKLGCLEVYKDRRGRFKVYRVKR